MYIQWVSIWYGKKNIIRDVSITINPWEFVFLIGSSGSGKTSFIKMLIGDLAPKSWHIRDSKRRDIYTLSQKEMIEYRRKLWVVFQDFKLLRKKTVYENVAFAMEVCGYGDDVIKNRVPEILKQVGMLDKKNTFVEYLSWWEIQRTSIARALIHNPEIIIGDEPTGNLDPKNSKDIIELLEKLNQWGKTIIIATHDDRMVNQHRKRVIAFRDGVIVSDEMEWRYTL